MKIKKLAILVLAIALAVFAGIAISTLTSCNVQMIDTTWSFERAVISLPNGDAVEGEVVSWLDYKNSDMVQVTIDDKTYLTHSANVVLISE